MIRVFKWICYGLGASLIAGAFFDAWSNAWWSFLIGSSLIVAMLEPDK